MLLLETSCSNIQAHLITASYNITHGKKNNWDLRKPGVCALIKQIGADIYGLQEVIKDNEQLDSIKQTLPDFGYVGQPRSSGIKGLSLWHRFVMKFAEDEHCPIFYNQNKVELLATETFGINGNNWTSALLPRICTLGKFKEIGKDKEFYVYNTHLDHKTEDMRLMQIKLIIDDISQRCNNTSVILMGDFNTTPTNNMEKILTENGFSLAKKQAKKVEGPDVTHEKSSTKKFIECDYILVKPKENFTVNLYKTFDTISEKTSDHNPVSIDFSLNK
jgi:endonuclease/exonuclease/phosphatase family metal-dependent hydrolase